MFVFYNYLCGLFAYVFVVLHFMAQVDSALCLGATRYHTRTWSNARKNFAQQLRRRGMPLRTNKPQRIAKQKLAIEQVDLVIEKNVCCWLSGGMQAQKLMPTLETIIKEPDQSE